MKFKYFHFFQIDKILIKEKYDNIAPYLGQKAIKVIESE